MYLYVIAAHLVNLFKQYNLLITIETNIRTVNFLDTTFDLLNSTYKHYRKSSDEPLHINKHSNHPPTVLCQLPKSISKRVSEISSNEEIFKQSIPIYEKALKDSGFNEKLVYNKENTTSNEQNQKKKRKRKTIWFNPPYSSTVKANVGKLFLKLVKQHFPKGHKLHKIFNKNTIKVSYSCLKNMSSVNHTRDFRNQHYEKSTELSKYI